MGELTGQSARDLARELAHQHTMEYLDAMTRCADQPSFVKAYLDEQSVEMERIIARAGGDDA